MAAQAAVALRIDPPISSWFHDPNKPLIEAVAEKQGILEALARAAAYHVNGRLDIDRATVRGFAKELAKQRDEMTTLQARKWIRNLNRRWVEAVIRIEQEKSLTGELVITEAMAKKAAAVARQARRSHGGSLVSALGRAINRTIENTVREYRMLHPGTTEEEIDDALAAVAAMLASGFNAGSS
jgi:hypothetical protein